MEPDADFDELPDDDPDLLENCGLSKLFVHRLRHSRFRRLSEFDGVSDVEMLREPLMNGRMMKAIKALLEERARLAAE